MPIAATNLHANDDLQRIVNAWHHDPHSVLGRHTDDFDHSILRAHIPGAQHVAIDTTAIELERLAATDLFQWRGPTAAIPTRYRLRWQDRNGRTHCRYDPYCFPPLIDDFDLHLLAEGNHWHVYRFLGAHNRTVDGIDGVLFATWAPSAERVSVIGDFNDWDGRHHPMRVRSGSGVWEIFIPELPLDTLYKFEIRNRATGQIFVKSDPYGQQFEVRPKTASRVAPQSGHHWQDGAWLTARTERDWLHAPLSIYEVHLGSWRRDDHGGFPNYRELAHQLVDYVKELGFTHIELLPITEHPLDGSWGYQTIGYYAPTSRFGNPDDFRYFVDYCHQHGIGVLLDWAPGHFPKDPHGLAYYDGSALFEHEDPRLGEHRDWGTLIFNYGRNEVRNFLISSAVYWLEEFHIDGLRVDAVASMLYLDYSRQEGEWVPNQYGGNENLDAIHFLRRLNEICHQQYPGTLIMAEESTAWPMVSRPVWLGGLGFSMKWNMGWMHDSLNYIHKDPIHRHYHHGALTFSLEYAFNENFILPYSHDEVVHGKGALLEKMPGDDWQRFANLRLLYCYMFTHPGKKLLFMGCEFAQRQEWNYDQALDWHLLQSPPHQGVKALIRDLNRCYTTFPALHYHDFSHQGFSWIDCNDAAQSILVYSRRYNDTHLVIALNFTPVPRKHYRIGVPHAGTYRELINTDSQYYGGSNMGNGAGLQSEALPWMGCQHSVELTLPPLAGLVLQPISD